MSHSHKRCTCGGDLIYTWFAPGRLGYICSSCGFKHQKKPRLPKGKIAQHTELLNKGINHAD